ncbi:MAG TPA: LLM class F420-dependent oxidoreductase, partial [Mycobacterium sp.]|nr:LLM class F420-dependent oxidoreductase [Mycobacterium sp.]
RWWSPEKVRERRSFLADACAAADRDPATLRLSVTTLLAPTESSEQEAEVRAEFASIPAQGLIVGSPQQCVDRINEYREAGVDTFLFTIPHVATSDYIHTAGDSVLNTFTA